MDSFSRIGLPRRLHFSEGEVEDALRAAAKSAHPDAGGDAAEFAKIGRAGDLLKSPATRLKVALELSGAEISGRGSVPTGIMDLFSPVANLLEEVSAFISERAKARSALGKAMLDARIPDLKVRLEALVDSLVAVEEGQVERFIDFDRRGWEESLEEMEEGYRALLFVSKWLAQLREATGKIFEALLAG